MAYYLDLNDQIRFGMVDPETPEEMAERLAEETGMLDADNFGVSPEGLAALNGEPWERSAYLYGYHERFVFRKRMDGEITEDDWYYYDPFRPEAWNYGLIGWKRTQEEEAS